MSKADRQKIFDKYGGKCAYCGCELQKGWHVDQHEAYAVILEELDELWTEIKKNQNPLTS